jgi:hypothetical protein
MNGSRNTSSARLKPSVTKNVRSRSKNASLNERRISTPSPDSLVVDVRRPKSKEAVAAKEKASTLVASLLRATRKPGTNREAIFSSNVGKRVFAYSVYPKDTTKIVREDASGKTSIGRFVNGRFRALSARMP